MDYKLKKQLHILIQLASSDKEFTESEKQAILKIGHNRGAKTAEIEEIIAHPDINESLAPMTFNEKMDFMLDSMTVVLADKKIHPDEKQFVEQTAKKLGFRKEVVDFLMEYQSMDRRALKELMVPYLIQDYF